MLSSISSLALAPRNPEVSMQVWMPIFLAPARSLPAKAGCMRTSPPDSVIPPLDARKTPR